MTKEDVAAYKEEKAMTKDDLLNLLRRLEGDTGDLESAHIDADDALLAYIADPEISEAYNNVGKWYA